MVHINFTEAAEVCLEIDAYISTASGGVYEKDNRMFDSFWTDYVERPLANYFNADLNSRATDVWTAIHVESSTKSPIFEMENIGVDSALLGHRLLDFSSNYTSLFNANSPVLIYAGEFDQDSGPVTQEVWLRTLDIPDKEAFWGQARSIYKVYDEEH